MADSISNTPNSTSTMSSQSDEIERLISEEANRVYFGRIREKTEEIRKINEYLEQLRNSLKNQTKSLERNEKNKNEIGTEQKELSLLRPDILVFQNLLRNIEPQDISEDQKSKLKDVASELLQKPSYADSKTASEAAIEEISTQDVAIDNPQTRTIGEQYSTYFSEGVFSKIFWNNASDLLSLEIEKRFDAINRLGELINKIKQKIDELKISISDAEYDLDRANKQLADINYKEIEDGIRENRGPAPQPAKPDTKSQADNSENGKSLTNDSDEKGTEEDEVELSVETSVKPTSARINGLPVVVHKTVDSQNRNKIEDKAQESESRQSTSLAKIYRDRQRGVSRTQGVGGRLFGILRIVWNGTGEEDEESEDETQINPEEARLAAYRSAPEKVADYYRNLGAILRGEVELSEFEKSSYRNYEVRMPDGTTKLNVGSGFDSVRRGMEIVSGRSARVAAGVTRKALKDGVKLVGKETVKKGASVAAGAATESGIVAATTAAGTAVPVVGNIAGFLIGVIISLGVNTLFKIWPLIKKVIKFVAGISLALYSYLLSTFGVAVATFVQSLIATVVPSLIGGAFFGGLTGIGGITGMAWGFAGSVGFSGLMAAIKSGAISLPSLTFLQSGLASINGLISGITFAPSAVFMGSGITGMTAAVSAGLAGTSIFVITSWIPQNYLPFVVRAKSVPSEYSPHQIFSVSKTADPVSLAQDKDFDSGTDNVKINYTLTIKADHDASVKINSVTDSAMDYGKEKISVVYSQEAKNALSALAGTVIASGDEIVVPYSVVLSKSQYSSLERFNDSNLVNTVIVDGEYAQGVTVPKTDRQIQKAQAIVRIGNPKDDQPYAFPIAGLVTSLDGRFIMTDDSGKIIGFKSGHCGGVYLDTPSANTCIPGGIDIANIGDVISTITGTVIWRSFDLDYGGVVYVEPENKSYRVAFIHLAGPIDSMPDIGTKVVRGVSKIGNTYNDYKNNPLKYSTGPHVHYQVLRGGTNVMFSDASSAGKCSEGKIEPTKLDLESRNFQSVTQTTADCL